MTGIETTRCPGISTGSYYEPLCTSYCNVPLGTVKWLIHHARKRLEPALKAYAMEEFEPMVKEVFGEHKLPAEWSKKTWETCISRHFTWFTPYDAGWDGSRQYGEDMSRDEELRSIVAMEQAAAPIPDWAQEVVKKSINTTCPCGHYLYPAPYWEIIAAIGSQTPPQFVHSCYTAEPSRKERAMDYMFCLDAWLAGASAQDALRELAFRKRSGPNWDQVCRALYNTLGDRTELKELLVERLVHRYRWWAKALVWEHDSRDRFGQSSYLGDIRCSGDSYGNPDFLDPYFVEMQSPRVGRIEARITELRPDWKDTWSTIGDTWLCGAKSFRWLERIVWMIGHGRQPNEGEVIPGFLQCEDTYPNQDEAAEFHQEFIAALENWWRGESVGATVADKAAGLLGRRTEVKAWLVRLFLRKLALLVKHGGNVGRLVNPSPSPRRGTRPVA